MMEENINIFLTGGDALVYLAEPVHKKYSVGLHILTFLILEPYPSKDILTLMALL